MTEKDKKELIEILLADKQRLEMSINISEMKIKCEKDHLQTIDNTLDNLQD